MILRVLHWVCRCVLAGVFLYSGYVKIHPTLQFAIAITGYKLVPERLILPLATYLPWAEMLLGLLLLIGWKIRYVSTGAAGLLLVFIVVLAITYFRGIEADCGCFGLGDRISPLTIVRDSLFLLPAIFLASEARIQMRWKDSAKPNPS
jgi:uncharacterized membrane protein YphA (DoxX/SURF4 family)